LVAFVDRTEQLHAVMRKRSAPAAEGGAAVDALGDLIPQAGKTAIVWIALGQEIPVLRVERKEQAIEKREGRVAQCGQVGCIQRGGAFGIGPHQGAQQVGENLLEDEVGQALADLGFPVPAFLQGQLMEGAAVRSGLEGLATEHQPEQLQEVIAPFLIGCEWRRSPIDAQLALAACKTEHPGEVDFEVILEPGFRTLVVEAPVAPVGEDAPENLAVRLNVGTRQIANDLSRGRLVTGSARTTLVEAKGPGFGIGDGDAERVALCRPGLAIRFVEGVGR